MALTVTDDSIVIYDGGSGSVTNWSNSGFAAQLWQSWGGPDLAAGVMSFRVSGGSGIGYYTHPTLTFDFTTTYAGKHVALYVYCNTPSLLTTLANGGGLFLIAGSASNKYYKFLIASGDDYTQLGDGLIKFSFDPRKTPTATVGTPVLSALKVFGIAAGTPNTISTYNLFVGSIRIEGTLKITGTSTSFWGDAFSLKRDRIQKVCGDTFSLQGVLEIGGGTENTDVSDSFKSVFFGFQKYYRSGAWYGLRADTLGIYLKDSSAYYTKFTDGFIVDGYYGAGGSQVESEGSSSGEITISTLTNTSSKLKLLGTHILGFTSGVNLSNVNVAPEVRSVNFEYCGIIFLGYSLVRDSHFTYSSSNIAAAQVATYTDIKDSRFIANDRGSAIRLAPYSAQYSLRSLKFAGNGYDLYNSAPSLITVNQYEGSNATTYYGNILLKSATDVRIEGTVSLIGAEVRIYDLNDPSGDFGTELAGVESCATSYFDFTETPGNTVWIQILLQGYKEYGKKVLIPMELNYIFTADLQRDYNL